MRLSAALTTIKAFHDMSPRARASRANIPSRSWPYGPASLTAGVPAYRPQATLARDMLPTGNPFGLLAPPSQPVEPPPLPAQPPPTLVTTTENGKERRMAVNCAAREEQRRRSPSAFCALAGSTGHPRQEAILIMGGSRASNVDAKSRKSSIFSASTDAWRLRSSPLAAQNRGRVA